MTSRRLARAINERWERGLQTEETIDTFADEYHKRMAVARADLAALREPTETLDRIEAAQ